MPRTKGARTENRDVQPEGRTKIWGAMRFLKTFTLEEIEQTTGCSYPNVRRYMKRLERAGYVRVAKVATGNRYRLIRNTGPLAPIPQFEAESVFDPNSRETYSEERGEATARQQAWDYMRRAVSFSSLDLQRLGLTKANALKYLAALESGGYLVLVEGRKSGPKGRPASYRLVDGVGEVAPVAPHPPAPSPK